MPDTTPTEISQEAARQMLAALRHVERVLHAVHVIKGSDWAPVYPCLTETRAAIAAAEGR